MHSTPSLFEKATSPERLQEAWERVRSNTPGHDEAPSTEVRIEQRLEALSDALRSGSYEPAPLREILVPKGPGKTGTRRLLIPDPVDRVAQEAVRIVLTRRLEPRFLDCSFAYRRGAGPLKAIRRVDQYISRDLCSHVVRGDIHDCFPSVDRPLLLSMLSDTIRDDTLVALIEKWLSAGVIVRTIHWEDSFDGLPQGSGLSPLLANLYLTAFDRPLVDRGARLVRYADDFLILAQSSREADAALVAAEHILGDRLNLALGRKAVLAIAEGFDFLGLRFREQRRELAPDRLEAIRQKLQALSVRPTSDVRGTISELRLSATGWARYYGRALTPAGLVPLRNLLLDALESLLRKMATVGTPDRAQLLESIREVELPGVTALHRRRSLLRDLVRRVAQAGDRAVSRAAKMRRRRRRHFQRTARTGHVAVREPGTFAGKSGRFLVLRRDRRVVERIPLEEVTSLTVADHGVALSSDVARSCAGAGVPLLFEAADHSIAALLSAPARLDPDTAVRQLQTATHPARCVELARRFCLAKVRNQLALLKYMGKYRARTNAPFRDMVRACVEGGRSILSSFRTATALDEGLAVARAHLMGLEALAAAAYWSAVRTAVTAIVPFESRIRRGASDPFNAMLNYGYAILSRRVHLAVLATGLLPEVGFLHAASPRRFRIAVNTFGWSTSSTARCERWPLTFAVRFAIGAF